MIYPKNKTSQISFPLGGIGSGCIGLSGNGHLVDWEIYNSANKGSTNGHTHFAIRTEDSSGVKYRILKGDCPEPYTGFYRYDMKQGYTGYGWGTESAYLSGLPHFRNHEFRGTFPVAKVVFSGEEEDFPLSAELSAWSPFCPGCDRDSSMPCAILEYTFRNIGKEPVKATAIGVLANPWWGKLHYNHLKGNRLSVYSGKPEDDLEHGMITLAVLEPEDKISGQEYWYRGGWVDALEMYLNDINRGGRLPERTYPTGTEYSDLGTLATYFDLIPGEKKTVSFLLTWHYPNRENNWDKTAVEKAQLQGIPIRWKNYYATQWKDSLDSSRELELRLNELRTKTMRFAEEMDKTSLPQAIIDGSSANLSILKTPTCLRLEDGTFWGWEGIGTAWGSCQGSCIHVWNYAQSLPFLFPAMERTMRESHLGYSVDDFGGAHFRRTIPYTLKADTTWFRPCVDGQFGEIMKFYRDWKITGDNTWLSKWYPTLKKMMQFTWSEYNTDCWDPEKSGMLTGRQHHTLDMELFGPNGWLESHYLGALLAMTKLALAADDESFAAECQSIFEKGCACAGELFNGEYFSQKIDLSDRNVISKWKDANSDYWNDETGEIKYQIADGCEIDSCLGAFYASFYGIGDVFDRNLIQKNLQSIYKYNFVNMRDHINPWRTYALNDETGVCICTWKNGSKKPTIPIPYNTEMMNGFEWTFAAHLMLEGYTKEAENVAVAIRKRYDGSRRNPWNEFECGNNYARSMAAFGLIPAAAGFQFDMTKKFIGFSPKYTGDFRTIWSIGSAWGNYIQTDKVIEINLLGGELVLNSISLPLLPRIITSDNINVSFQLSQNNNIVFNEPLTVSNSVTFQI